MVLMSKPNFLILDEPTNDLDISTLEILEDYLSKFNGCVIIVSHDRFFMDRTVDHTFVFMGDGVVKDFPGNYSEYRAWKDYHDHLAQQQARAIAKPKEKAHHNTRDNSNKLTYKERKELEALTVEIETLTDEREQLDALFSSGQVINDMDAKSMRYNELNTLLEEKEMRWLELSEIE
jgi:ATP-binding cassette subfamily F protein uup